MNKRKVNYAPQFPKGPFREEVHTLNHQSFSPLDAVSQYTQIWFLAQGAQKIEC